MATQWSSRQPERDGDPSVPATLELVRLPPVMDLTAGSAELRLGLIDGPVEMSHPDLVTENVQMVNSGSGPGLVTPDDRTLIHGTFVAGILFSRRGASALAICPGCSLLIRYIFSASENGGKLLTTPGELADAIIDVVNAGAHVLNLSVYLTHSFSATDRVVTEALDYAARRGVITVAAVGNQGQIDGSSVTRHPGVIPVVACDSEGAVTPYSNLAASAARTGLRAPGENIISLGPNGGILRLSGTSAATAIVAGAIALIWSLHPSAPPSEIREAVTARSNGRGHGLVPPMLDARRAHEKLENIGRL
jgi:subtilisin family serine protease